MSYYIVMLGAPGSGKGTQTDLLSKAFGYTTFSTGDIIRKEIEEGSEIGQLANKFLSNGELVPDHVIIDMFKKTVQGKYIAEGFISDGFPRTVEQAEAFKCILENGKWPIKVFSLEVSLPMLKERLLNRKRSDDTPETIEKRFEIFSAIVTNLKECFQDNLIQLDGEKSPEEVFQTISDYLR